MPAISNLCASGTSSKAASGIPRTAASAGFDLYLLKPIEPEALEASLRAPRG